MCGTCREEIINIQTGEVLDWSKVDNLPDNAMLKVKPELFDEWDFEKNNKLGLDIYKMTKGTHKKVNWSCVHGHEWVAQIDSRSRLNSNCPVCSGRVASKDDNLLIKNPKLCEEWDYIKNKKSPKEYKPNSSQKAWWICKGCGSSYNSIIANRNKGVGCPYCAGQKTNYTNCLVTTHPHLIEEWHPTLNDDLTPYDVTSGMDIKIWWQCENNHEWESVLYSRTNGCGCPYCSNKKVDSSNSLSSLRPDLASQWHPTKNGNKTPDDFTCGSGEKVWWVCDCGNKFERSIIHMNDSKICKNCIDYSYRITVGVNDMYTTNPDLAKLLANHEDGFKYTEGSGENVDWKCPDCGEIIKDKKIAHIKHRGLSCPICNDGIKFPEKVMYHLLKELDINFYHDRTTEWSVDKRYDFFISANSNADKDKYKISENTIIEMHGGQHIKEGFKTVGGRTLKEEQENDKFKRELALSNGIQHYISIDCRKSDFEFIKSNILNSELSELFDLNNINWLSVYKKTQSSILYDICSLWNEGYSIKNISLYLNKSRNTITKYLKIGADLNVCEYNVEESYVRGYKDAKKKERSVVQLSDEMKLINIFKSITEAKNQTCINTTSIQMCCKGKRNRAGNYIWMYKSDYDEHVKQQNNKEFS